MPSTLAPQIKPQPTTPSFNIANVPSPAASPTADVILPSTEAPTTTIDTTLFTFLPDLYLLISRLSELRHAPGTDSANGNANTNNLTQIHSRESGHSARSASGGGGGEPTIEVRDLPAHIYGIKKRIAEAREGVAGIPGVQRTVEELEGTVVELKAQCEGLRERLAVLGNIAESGAGDVVMKG